MSSGNDKTIQLSKYLENIIPFIIVSAIALFVYCISLSYLYGFFSNLSIDFASLHLSIIYFLQKTIIPIAKIFFIGLFVFILYESNREKNKFFKRTFTILIIPIVLLFLIRGIYFNSQTSLLNLNYIFLAFLFYVLLDYKNFTHIFTFIPKSKALIIFALIILFSIFSLSYYQGVIDAKHLVEGKNLSLLTKLEFKKTFKDEAINKDLIDKELIFVVFANDSYYLTEKQIPAPEKANTYIVPKNTVKYIKMKELK
ncbi:MAG: hypothetical protein AAF630_08740 [Cyanobacteria bacterium P01_C01_bin.38]